MTTFIVTPPGSAGTLDIAYHLALPGDTIVMQPGNYVAQTINPDATKVGPGRVEISAAVLGTVFIQGQSLIHGSWITWKNLEFARISTTTGRPTGNEFYRCHIHTASFTRFKNLKLKTCQIGPNRSFTSRTGLAATSNSDDGLYFGSASGFIPEDILLEDVHIRGIGRPNPVTSHSDGIQFTSGARVTIRRVRTIDCYDASIIIKKDQGGISDFLIEQCHLDPPTNPGPTTGFMLADGNSGVGATNMVVRHNEGDPAKLLLTNQGGCEAYENLWTPITTYNCGQYTAWFGWAVHDNMSEGGTGCGTDSMVVV